MIHEFHLSPPGMGQGVSCDAEGAFIGAIPILNRLRRDGRDTWHPRDCEELSKQICVHYGLPIDMSSKTDGLRAIAKALNEGDVVRAQIATVLLGIPDPPQHSMRVCSRAQMIKFVQDLHWSGMIKWDADEHPRWPAGSDDSKGGQFAPKGEGAQTASPASQSDTVDRTSSYNPDSNAANRSAYIQLADAGMSDASDDPIAEAAARTAAAARHDVERQTFEHDDMSSIVLAAAEDEDERDSRFGIGGNHPPEELIPERLQQSPAGPAVQLFDNLLDISHPGDEANLEAAELQQRALLQRIHEIDPNYVYESMEPPGGLAGMSWQERLDTIDGLRADLAAAIYRIHGDIKPLQEVTFVFLQRTTNAAYDEAVQLYNKGELNVRLSREEAIGNYVDSAVRTRLGYFFNDLGIPANSGSPIRINSRAYNSSGSNLSYRVPDVRVGDIAFDMSLTEKMPSNAQIKGFFNADFKPLGVVIVRPNQLGRNSSYIIWRQQGS